MTKSDATTRLDLDPVLQAAARLFRHKGYERTTLREIARAANMLPGSLHYRFKTKEELLLALMDRAVDYAIAALRGAIAATRDPIERIRLGMREHLRLLLSGDDSVYVLLYEWRTLAGEARERMVRLRDRYEAFCDGLLYEAAGTTKLRDGVDLGLLRMFGFGALNWAAQWYRPDGRRTPEQVADAFWAYMAFGVLADDQRPADLTRVLQELSAMEPATAEG